VSKTGWTPFNKAVLSSGQSHEEFCCQFFHRERSILSEINLLVRQSSTLYEKVVIKILHAIALVLS